MSTATDKRSRKSVFQLSGFRARLIALIVIAGFTCVAVVTFLFYGYVLESYDVILRHSTLPDELVAERYSELWGIAIAMGGIIVALVIVVAVWALYITQRVSGPAYRMQQVIESIRAGRLDARVQIRKNDEFQELADSFNAMMDELQAKKGAG